MTTQTRDLARSESFSFVPRSLEEAEKYAMIIANSGVCPQGLKGRPHDVLVILQMGSELKLQPMQALRSLGCINGMPFAYGDGLLALVKRHPEFENMKEWMEGDIQNGSATAYCTVMRKNQDPQTRSFSIQDAQRAGLWKKAGPWSQYPSRMLQHRARNYACKDVFPDALFGLMTEDEARGVVETKVQEIKPTGKGLSGLKETLYNKVEEEIVDAEIIMETFEENVSNNPILDDLLLLIEQNNISIEIQNKWCKKANVSTIAELSVDSMTKLIDHYRNKEKK